MSLCHYYPLCLLFYHLTFVFFFFFNDTATTEIYTLSLHDALPTSRQVAVSVTGWLAGRRPERTREQHAQAGGAGVQRLELAEVEGDRVQSPSGEQGEGARCGRADADSGRAEQEHVGAGRLRRRQDRRAEGAGIHPVRHAEQGAVRERGDRALQV